MIMARITGWTYTDVESAREAAREEREVDGLNWRAYEITGGYTDRRFGRLGERYGKQTVWVVALITRHTLRAERQAPGRWVLRNLNSGELVGGDSPDHARTRARIYRDCDAMWGSGFPWYGRRIHGGYSIEVD